MTPFGSKRNCDAEPITDARQVLYRGRHAPSGYDTRAIFDTARIEILELDLKPCGRYRTPRRVALISPLSALRARRRALSRDSTPSICCALRMRMR